MSRKKAVRPNLFQGGKFELSSGIFSRWKIQCEALTDEDLITIASQVALVFRFTKVEFVPTGGERFAKALEVFKGNSGKVLLVDDVMTTGASMEKIRAGRHMQGVVLFARGTCPGWVWPVFQLNTCVG